METFTGELGGTMRKTTKGQELMKEVWIGKSV